MSLHDGFKILPAKLEDRDRIEVFVRRHVYISEPLNSTLGIPNGHSCTTKIVPLEKLHEGLSLIAVTTSSEGQERIVGICLNGEDTPNDNFKVSYANECDKYKKINACLGKVHRDADIFKGTDASRALDLYLLAVDPECRRSGIGRALIEHAISCVAKEKGFPMVAVLCTSFYTAKIAEALNMKCVHVMRYDEYLDDDGVPLFSPPKPHEAIKVFTLTV